MSELETIREIVSTVGGGGVLITLFLLWKLGFFNGKKDDVSAQIEELKQYFNHDTTNYHEKTHEKLDNLKGAMVELTFSIKDIRDNGVPCKEKK